MEGETTLGREVDGMLGMVKRSDVGAVITILVAFALVLAGDAYLALRTYSLLASVPRGTEIRPMTFVVGAMFVSAMICGFGVGLSAIRLLLAKHRLRILGPVVVLITLSCSTWKLFGVYFRHLADHFGLPLGD